MAFDSLAAAWWPFVFILLAGFLPTDVWRWLGVALGGTLRPDGMVLTWVKAVATAIIAGVIGILVVFPAGALAELPLALRLFAALAGYGAFVAGGRVVWGIVVSEIVLVGGAVLLGSL